MPTIYLTGVADVAAIVVLHNNTPRLFLLFHENPRNLVAINSVALVKHVSLNLQFEVFKPIRLPVPCLYCFLFLVAMEEQFKKFPTLNITYNIHKCCLNFKIQL